MTNKSNNKIHVNTQVNVNFNKILTWVINKALDSFRYVLDSSIEKDKILSWDMVCSLSVEIRYFLHLIAALSRLEGEKR